MKNAHEALVVRTLANYIYETLPETYATYCSLVSRISVKVLDHFNIPAKLHSCQLWHTTHNGNHVVGFIGNEPLPGKWDGHVVCMTDSFLLDGALRNLQRDFDLPVPAVAVASLFRANSHVLAQLVLDTERMLWWHNAPSGVDAAPPAEPENIVEGYVRDLVDKVASRLGSAARRSEGLQAPRR